MRTFDSPRERLCSPLAPEAPLTDIVRWAVAHASLAPSELNSQPWRFRVEVDLRTPAATLQLWRDETRALPTVDPGDREALLACGAALLNLRLALRGAGLGAMVQLRPDPSQPELLAVVVVRGGAGEPEADRPLRLAIPLRGTHRAGFEPASVPAHVVDRLVAEAAFEGASIAVLDDRERTQFAALNEHAESRLWVDPAFRREVASWSRTNTSSRSDGVPGFASGRTMWQSWLEPAWLRAGLAGTDDEARREAVDGAPVLLVIGAANETTEALLRAGAGMQRLLLYARSVGLAASYLNAALHVPELRRAVGRSCQLDHPQVALRIGYAEVDRFTPRRPESAVLDLREAVRRSG
jgi:nitroreductase